MLSLTLAEGRRVRLWSQGLGPHRERGLAALARECGAVQAQDRMGELLAIRARSNGLTTAVVEQARVEQRAVVRTWLMRGTLHLVHAADLRWMLSLLGATMDRKALRRRANLGVTDESYADSMEVMRRELGGGRCLSRTDIVERIRGAGLPWGGQTVPHLIRSASLSGLICFGPAANGEDTYVLLDEWLSADQTRPSDPAAELARCYFAAYGPASAADFRSWSGLPAAGARTGVSALADELTALQVDGKRLWMLSGRVHGIEDALAVDAPLVRVLGPFDPYLLGYSRRELGVPDEQLRLVHPGGGMILPVILADGVMLASWRRRATRRGITITVDPLTPLSMAQQDAIDGEITDIGRFLSLEARWEIKRT